MNARIWKFAAALCLAAVAAGCSKDEGHTPAQPGPSVSVTPSATSVVANGTNIVTLNVTDTGAVAVTVTTDRGTLNGGVTSYVIPAGTGATTGTVTLTTCNSATNLGCPGVAAVRATSTSGVANASINFTSLASACQTNCGADAGCAGLVCALVAGGTGTCSATTPSSCLSAPACTPTAATETSCSGGVDEDCNGKTDCADSACDGQACKPGSPTFVCASGACTDLASGLAVVVTPARTRLPANGTASTTVTVAVTQASKPVANAAVTLSTNAGTLSATTGTTDDAGELVVTFTAPATAAVARITAASTLVPSVSGSATITMPQLGSLQIPATWAAHPVMGVKSSGFYEFGAVMVQALDDQGVPYPDGLAVRFEHRSLGGSTFGPPLATTNLGTCTAAAGCVAYDGVVSSGPDPAKIDTTGLAAAPLFSGTLAGTLVVTATTTASGETRTVTLPSVAVVGAKASAANFSIQCSPRNVPALAETDCSTSWVDAPFTCVALLKDRFDNLLGTSTQVIFASEAAAVGQVAWSPAYDPSTQGTEQKDLGTATQIFQTLGAGLPFDVDPQPGEQFVSHALDGCGVRTHNPRDGVVTIIAIADGEEAFFDANGNGQYDAGEPFIDQGEPFIDENDNGQWDPGEWFLDVDGDHAYTPANGTWDAQAKIWTQTVVVYTGYAADWLVKDAATPTFLGTRWVGGFTDACTATPAPPAFSVTAKRAGPPEVPPTSVGRVVVASDWNLNFLTSGTKYGVGVEGAGKVKTTYNGLASYADMLGMAYQYWPCDQSGACASQCRATGAAAPCVMTPALSDFSCGVAASVVITGGDSSDGTNYVDFTVDVPWSVYLGGKVMHTVVTTSGTNNP